MYGEITPAGILYSDSYHSTVATATDQKFSSMSLAQKLIKQIRNGHKLNWIWLVPAELWPASAVPIYVMILLISCKLDFNTAFTKG